jgi:uncharacterized membrane protein
MDGDVGVCSKCGAEFDIRLPPEPTSQAVSPEEQVRRMFRKTWQRMFILAPLNLLLWAFIGYQIFAKGIFPNPFVLLLMVASSALLVMTLLNRRNSKDR